MGFNCAQEKAKFDREWLRQGRWDERRSNTEDL